MIVKDNPYKIIVKGAQIKKKSNTPLVLKLIPTEDILQNVIKSKTKQFVVGFAAESANLIQSALVKLRNKKLDLIVVNDISAPGIGFQSDSNQVTLINKDEHIDKLPLLPKIEIANRLFDEILKLRSEAGYNPIVKP